MIQDLSFAPGTRQELSLPIPGLDKTHAIPVIVLQGIEPGPTLTALAGVHGSEYGGISALLRLSQRISPTHLKGTLILAPLVSRAMFHQRSVYRSPMDGQNPNRSFPGHPEGSATQRLAHTVFQGLIQGSDYLVDLHAGDAIEALEPFSLYDGSAAEPVAQKARELALAFGLPYLLRSSLSGSTYTAAARAGIPAIIAEIGGQGIWDPRAVERHLEGVGNVLCHLGMLSETPRQYPKPREFARFAWATAPQGGLFERKVEAGDTVEEGQPVGDLYDIFGRPVAQIPAPASGPVLFVNTALAISEGDPILGIAAGEMVGGAEGS